MPSNYLPGQVLTAAELNASLNAKADSVNPSITGGQIEGLNHLYVTGTTPSTNPTTGAVTVAGGVGVSGDTNVGGQTTVGGDVTAGGNAAVTGRGTFGGRLTSAAKIMGVNGANLLSNSSAEFGNLGWATSVFAAAVGASGQGGQFANTGSILTNQQDYSNPITIGAAVAVVIAAEINTSGVTAGRAFVALEAFDAGNASLGVFARAVATNGNGYTSYWVAGTTPASTASVKVSKGVDTSPNVSVGGLAFRRIKYEVGTTPSVYSQEASVASVAGNANGELTLDVSAADVTLTVDQASNGIFKFIGTLTGNRTITYPATPHAFVVQNLTTGLFTLTIKAAGQTPSATVVQGKSATLFSDATGVYATSSAAGLSFAGVNAFSGNQSLSISNIGNIITQSAASVTTFPKANTIPAGSGFGFANIDTNAAHVVQLALQAGDTADLAFPFNVALNDVFFWYSDGISKWKLGWYSNKFNPIFEGLLTAKGGINMSGGTLTFPDGTTQTSATSGTSRTTTIYSVAAGNVTVGAATIVTTTGFAAPFVDIYRNGAHMQFGIDFTLAGDNKTINLLANTVSGFDEFEVLTGFTYNPSTVYIPTSTLYTPIAGATGIAVTYTPGFAYLYRNGVRLVPGVDYTALDGANITFVGFTGDGVTQYELWLFIPLTPANCLSANSPVITTGPLTFSDGSQQSIAFGVNRIINGSMRIQQRVAASFAAGGSIGYSALDRWKVSNNATTGVIGTNIGISTDQNGVSKPFLVATVSTAFVSPTGAQSVQPIYQLIEGYNAYDLYLSPVTVSFIVRGNVPGTYAVTVRDGTGTYSCVKTFVLAAASTPQRVALSFPAIPAAAAIPFGGAAGIVLYIGAISGPTLQAPSKDVWLAGNYNTSSDATNWLGTIGNLLSVTDVQLEKGTVATPFEYKSIIQERADCDRYYCTGTIRGTIVQINYMGAYAQFRVPMRANPTMTYNDALGAASRVSVSIDGNGRTVAGGSPINGPSVLGFTCDAIVSNTSTVNTWFLYNWTADAEL